ncbi:MAG: TetR family transcriptional regulator [Spirochaetia bacterium]|jgi:AcrR family transcriptional regulator
MRGARGEARTGSRAARQRILEAAITRIEAEGLRHVTIRGVAREAGANSAAISYYFGSKDRLIEEALKQTLENAFGDWERLLETGGAPARESLRIVLGELLRGAQRFPGLVKAHLYEPFIHGRFNTPFVRRFQRFLMAMEESIRAAVPPGDRRNAGVIASQASSAVLLPAIMPGLFRRCKGMNLKDPREAERYVAQVLRRLLGAEGKRR